MDEVTGAPENYDELFTYYFDFIKAQVARAGIMPRDVEDVASEILLRFVEKDFLAKYDGGLLHDVGDHPRIPGARMRPARFQGLLRSFVGKYVLQYRDKQMTKARKEPIYCDQPVGSSEGEQRSWIDLFSDNVVRVDVDDLEFWSWVGQAAHHLDQLEVRGKRDLAAVFRATVAMVVEDGRADRAAVAEKVGMAYTSVSMAYKDLRAELVGIEWATPTSRGHAAA